MEYKFKWIINDLNDEAISSSSDFNEDHAATLCRLNTTTGKANWSAKKNNTSQWLQVDLGNTETIVAVAVQGRFNLSQWVSLYNLHISENLIDWTVFEKIKGASDQDTVVEFLLPKPVSGRYVRFVPQEWHKHISMRVDVGVEEKSDKQNSEQPHTGHAESKKSNSGGIIDSQIQDKIEKFNIKEFDSIYKVEDARNFDFDAMLKKIDDEMTYSIHFICDFLPKLTVVELSYLIEVCVFRINIAKKEIPELKKKVKTNPGLQNYLNSYQYILKSNTSILKVLNKQIKKKTK